MALRRARSWGFRLPSALIRPSVPLIRRLLILQAPGFSGGQLPGSHALAGFGPPGAADAGLSNDPAAQQCTPALLGEPAGPAGSRLRGCRNKHRAEPDNRVEPAGHSPRLPRDHRGRAGHRRMPGHRRWTGSPHRADPKSPIPGTSPAHPDTARMLDNKAAAKKTLDTLPPWQSPIRLINQCH